MKIYKHPHPGEIVKDLLERNHLTVSEAAKKLNVVRTTISLLVNCHSSISTEMAIRLTALFGGEVDTWVILQANYDCWKAIKDFKKIAKNINSLKKNSSKVA